MKKFLVTFLSFFGILSFIALIIVTTTVSIRVGSEHHWYAIPLGVFIYSVAVTIIFSICSSVQSRFK